ncbi:hypothetical protein VFPFJ_09465 [Purpureocillium lilacinum]|uniref:Uncharacterized protein n=1 Tax=Purpureocillium lilacinum TaxID=33203 RepID=A0A179GDC8_PURLI|nr:hypothetical protein VFPFJ_09465 [Purpureocillium lilacinum]OAQ75381.1 hypothetical protein VFPBJ_09354 [Purpureocillium lilacinum]OAQ81010.1 hypothetical protein VFPFJ_09465 [Purpureocillium lilacinum]
MTRCLGDREAVRASIRPASLLRHAAHAAAQTPRRIPGHQGGAQSRTCCCFVQQRRLSCWYQSQARRPTSRRHPGSQSGGSGRRDAAQPTARPGPASTGPYKFLR